MNGPHAQVQKKKVAHPPTPAETPSGGSPPDGLAPGSWESVRLGDIDTRDQAFQYRFPSEVETLEHSLRTEGQREPVDLIGRKPYRIVDGFRRILAAAHLGWPAVKAFVHRDMTEDDAYRIAFTKNVVRRNLSPLERAQALFVAMRKRGLREEQLREAFGISEKQVRRYLELLRFPDAIKRILDGAVVTMAHAKALAAYQVTADAETWRKRIESERLDAKALRRILARAAGKKPLGRPKAYMQRQGNRVRMYAFSIGRESPRDEREKVIRLLQDAIELLKG
jgi:ParB/RepB/Spo0J family partition protein